MASAAMKDAQPQTIFLKDYRVPEYLIDKTELHFDLGDTETLVTAQLHLRRNPESADSSTTLQLHGAEMQLRKLAIDTRPLAEGDYEVTPEGLSIFNVPAQFVLECVTALQPAQNTSLEGLYQSRGLFCTQCEAEGFRKITYYLDRPDVMSEFTTTLVADRDSCPVLLSNGNLIDEGSTDDGRHWAKWHDPFKKPAYLFALVAGNLSPVEDSFTTASGRKVALKIFVEEKDLNKCAHAMASLKHSMRWDEEVYGREYDLDIFMIVAVDDFNMGAMENKGLNIFNTSCVLARPETTTDAGYQRVEGVVAHEYFHNWSGNRVTCRDWFQLSLKEGFTVYRDAEFSADMGSRTVKRVEDVTLLRTLQFAEDAGPMAHPIRPESFMEISNFYTLTIYEKGAEIVRMIANLLGAEQFRQGSDLYFERHDGQAVTTEDFVQAMEDASGRDLTQFKRWYAQAGTPVLDVSGSYDEAAQEFSLTFKQSCPPTPECADKLAFHIPVAMGLLGEAGSLPLQLKGAPTETEAADNTHRVLELTEAEQTFVFEGVKERPVPSLLRGFSAPVRLHYDYNRDDLCQMMRADSDGFCRWDASQQLGVAVIEDAMAAYRAQQPIEVDSRLLEAYRSLLLDESLDKAMVALMLTLPSEAYLTEIAEQADVDAIHAARYGVRLAIAKALRAELSELYMRYDHSCAYSASAKAIAERSLCNTALAYLVLTGEALEIDHCYQQFCSANNMTDVMAALVALVNSDAAGAERLKRQALADYYTRWQKEPLVVNQWLQVQASCALPGGLERVKTLMEHEAFDIKNPNKVRSLIGGFCNQNAVNFHRPDGEGYRFLAEQIIALNTLNPQIAARMLTPLTKWRKYDAARQALMQQQLQHILAQPQLSKDVYEVVSKSLKN